MNATTSVPDISHQAAGDGGWKVGELARRTGLSVRALHHYDASGLLRPSRRTAAGHRLYGRVDVERLQQIQSLRLMGASLDEVRRMLDPHGGRGALSPRDVVAMHLTRLRAQIAAQTRLARRLEAVARQMDRRAAPRGGNAGGPTHEGVSVDALCTLIEAMTTMDRFDTYFTPEQLQTLEERRATVGEGRIHAVEDEWGEIIPAVRAAMDAGTDPTSPEVLALARRWKSLVQEFTGGDPAMATAVRTMYEREGDVVREHLPHTPTPDMFPYMGRAFAALGGGPEAR